MQDEGKTRIYARVDWSNFSSERAIRKAGYKKVGEVTVRHKLTTPRALGGRPVLLAAIVGIITLAAMMLFPEIHALATAVLLVLVILIVGRALEDKHQRAR